jgi:hypothetical protein
MAWVLRQGYGCDAAGIWAAITPAAGDPIPGTGIIGIRDRGRPGLDRDLIRPWDSPRKGPRPGAAAPAFRGRQGGLLCADGEHGRIGPGRGLVSRPVIARRK